VHGLGLEHEQLAAVSALWGGIDVEPRGPVMDDGHGPRRM
jgi:hypothetical protein